MYHEEGGDVDIALGKVVVVLFLFLWMLCLYDLVFVPVDQFVHSYLGGIV